MNNKEIFNRAYAKAQERIIENDIVYAHMGEGNPCKISYVQKIYDAALAHPHATVTKLLNSLNVSMTQYRNMKLTHLGIPEYRRQNLGKTRVLLQSEKEALTARLNKSKNASASLSRKKTKTRKDYTEYSGAGADMSEAAVYNAMLQRSKTGREPFDLDNA